MQTLSTLDPDLAAQLQQELSEVEVRFNTELASDLACVNQLVGHIEQYRGKMLRPTLVLVTGLATSAPEPRLTDAHRVIATVAEMVHMATLVHDDVLDEARVRRRGGTINHLQGNEAAVMLGDYLISHAYHLSTSVGSTEPARLIADATNTVCEGELLQLANRGNYRIDRASYFEIIRRKTAALCGVCCRLGALLSGAEDAVADGLAQYGEDLGTAFQIIDDVLDLTGEPDTVGKSVGRDMAKGKVTLPVIHALASLEGSEHRRLISTLEALEVDGSAPPPREPVETLRRLVTGSGALQAARQDAEQLVQRARQRVAGLNESAATTMLSAMADAVVDRRF